MFIKAQVSREMYQLTRTFQTCKMLLELLCFALALFVFFISTRHRVDKSKRQARSTNSRENETKEIRFEGKFYDVTDWIKRHPGGRIIEFYVNNDEDASLPIRQFHKRSEKRLVAILKSFKSRPILEDKGVNRDEKYEAMTEDFTKLFKELQEKGQFEPSLLYVALRFFELGSLAGAGFLLVTQCDNILAKAVGVLILSLFSLRSSYLAHEGGHSSLTGKPKADKLIVSIFMGIAMGLSGSWWSNMHNRHHAMPQRLRHDVDLQTLPLLAYNETVMEGNYDKYNKYIQHQGRLFLLTAVLGRMAWNLHTNIAFIFKKKRFHELFLISLHYIAAYHLGLYPYILVFILSSQALLLTFSMSHTHTPVTTEPRHWLEYSTIHTINVHPSWWCDYIMGYLNYQIEHHLLISLPQFRLRSVTRKVQDLVQKYDLPYTCISYGAAINTVFRNLCDVSTTIGDKAKAEVVKPF